MRIAMWSGPRNLSTAMMYAFAARGDCAVVDEPFYAAYLDKTGLDHPMRAEILASQPTNPNEVVAQISGSIRGNFPHFYQKHMTQHMIEGVPRDWIGDVVNVFLIRHPARVIASYAAKREDPTLEDIGFPQQLELYEQFGGVVVDSYDIRQSPRGMLQLLCDAIGLEFSEKMLSWPKGGHPDDGVWAAHWYGAVHNSTGFAPPEAELPMIEEDQREIFCAALDIYDTLKTKAITLG